MAQKLANLIGLAGQSCAGKNIVADFLEEKGYAVIDADKVAHTVLQEQSEVYTCGDKTAYWIEGH